MSKYASINQQRKSTCLSGAESMAKKMNLAQAVKQVENGWNVKVSVGNFERFHDFESYFNAHYKPLLESIRDGEQLDSKQRHLLNFLADDLIKAMYDDEGENF